MRRMVRLLLCTAAVAAPSTAVWGQSADDRPNVVLIMTDDAGVRRLWPLREDLVRDGDPR